MRAGEKHLPKAKTKKEFDETWIEHVKELNRLKTSLPRYRHGEVKAAVETLLMLVEVASEETFPNGKPKPGCTTCLHTGQGLHDKCTKCLQEKEGGGFAYSEYEHGDASAKIVKLEREGTRNIVIGGEGEMEVNSQWSYEEAYKKLFACGEEVGGMVYRESNRELLVTKAFDDKSYSLLYDEKDATPMSELVLSSIRVNYGRTVWTRE